MHWLSFLIGALIGWLAGWLIDYLICRPRRLAAEAELRTKVVDSANREVTTLKGQLAGHKDLQARLDGADGEITALTGQLGGMKDLQVHLDSANGEIDGLKAQLAGMQDVQANLDACRVELKQHKLEIEGLNAELATARAGAASLGAAAGLGLSEKRNLEASLDLPVTRAPEAIVPMVSPALQPHTPDDLTIVEGIGAKISDLLNQNGISTFAQLADASVERLRAILVSAGPRFRVADPETWPEQALRARNGEWEALKNLQDSLRGGRRA